MNNRLASSDSSSLAALRERNSVPLGYAFGQSDEAEKKALQTAHALLRQARELGAQTRLWTIRTLSETREKVAKVRVLGADGRPSADEGLLELTSWENEILEHLRVYMRSVSTLLSQLQELNPPLTSHQLRPYLQNVQMERQQTLISLAPLTKAVEELAALRSTLKQAAGQVYLFKPAI
jgi:hypothetical protein